MYCARHALGIQDSDVNGLKITAGGTTNEGDINAETSRAAAAAAAVACEADAGQTNSGGKQSNGKPNGGRSGGRRSGEVSGVANGGGDDDSHGDESFLLVLGDHLYRRGAGTTRACSSQLLHAFLEHGEAGKPAIGLKVSVDFAFILDFSPP